MRPGSVVSIRVNPRDSMSVVDIVKAAGLYIEGMSFPQMVSVALSGCLQALRDNNFIPDREGFEYNEMMGKYLTGQRGGQKLMVANTIHKQGSEFKVEGVKFTAEQREDTPQPHQEEHRTPEQVRAGRLLAELDAKRELAAENPNVIFSEDDFKEFVRLYKIVYNEDWILQG